MAFGIGEDPSRSVTPRLANMEYPTSPEELALTAADDGAPADIINLLKSLPRSVYRDQEEILRDLAEAARRFAMNGRDEDDNSRRDRRNIGRDAVENAQEPLTRHP